MKLEHFFRGKLILIIYLTVLTGVEAEETLRLEIPTVVESKTGIPLRIRSLADGSERILPATSVELRDGWTLATYNIDDIKGSWVARINGGMHGRLEWAWYQKIDFSGQSERVLKMPDKGVKLSILLPAMFLSSPKFKTSDWLVNLTRVKNETVDPFFFVWDAAQVSEANSRMDTFLPFAEPGNYTISIVSASAGEIYFQQKLDLKSSDFLGFSEAQKSKPTIDLVFSNADRWFGVVAPQASILNSGK